MQYNNINMQYNNYSISKCPIFFIYCRCEQLAEIIWQNRQQIKRVDLQRQQLPINNVGHDILPDLNVTITSLLSTLVTK